jgi:hypothetical protein
MPRWSRGFFGMPADAHDPRGSRHVSDLFTLREPAKIRIPNNDAFSMPFLVGMKLAYVTNA